MAASKSIREALNTLNDELLTAKLTETVRSITSTLTSRLRRLPPRSACLGLRGQQMVDRLERASEALEVLLRQRHCQCLKTWKTSPGRSKPGAGGPPVSPARGVAEGGVPDRATSRQPAERWSPSSAFSRALHVVPLAYPAAPSRLELFKRPLDATVERSYHPSTLTLDELHELR
jgi:hypothetical protein